MKPTAPPQALFYPFHLCHEETLAKIFLRFSAVHFRDFMALQLTPMVGMTAYPDRMGDSFPELLAAKRIVQGHNISGPLPADIVSAIDRDLADLAWRNIFERALRTDHRFQRGLFDAHHCFVASDTQWETLPYDVSRVRRHYASSDADAAEAEYGLALVKTAAALVYTYRLALEHGLQAATDSAAHFQLLEHTCKREHVALGNHLIVRKGY
ncbi:MAG TPA: hypothetical protein VFD86_10710 [Nitrospira sp.]|jgi:hypothetical protein|nr:hypothetical protein [Nitrospira sp.]